MAVLRRLSELSDRAPSVFSLTGNLRGCTSRSRPDVPCLELPPLHRLRVVTPLRRTAGGHVRGHFDAHRSTAPHHHSRSETVTFFDASKNTLTHFNLRTEIQKTLSSRVDAFQIIGSYLELHSRLSVKPGAAIQLTKPEPLPFDETCVF